MVKKLKQQPPSKYSPYPKHLHDDDYDDDDNVDDKKSLQKEIKT